METLGKIFGSASRVKIMRLFLFHPDVAFDIDDITERSLTKKPDTRKEINLLVKLGFIKKKSFFKKKLLKPRKTDTEPRYKKIKKKGWILNSKWEYRESLEALLIESKLILEKDIIARVKKAGVIKLLVLSGFFVKNEAQEVDMMIVAEKTKMKILEKEILGMEAEIGRKISYTVFTQDEYKYRLRMYDKLVRNILENEHVVLVSKLS
jgi:hypothetical protein